MWIGLAQSTVIGFETDRSEMDGITFKTSPCFITITKPQCISATVTTQILQTCYQSITIEETVGGAEAGIAGGFSVAGIGETKTYPDVIYPLNDFVELPKIVL